MIRRYPGAGSLPSAFTLLEVLVSSAILLAMMVLLLGACEGGSRFWNHAERRRAPMREAGASLRLISRDLRSAVLTDDPSSLMIRKGTNGGSSLFFLVSHAPDHRPESSAGDLCATGYFVAPSLHGGGEQDLYRFHASGHRVLEAISAGTLLELYAAAAPGSADTELLARNVASLEILPVGPVSPTTPPSALAVNIVCVTANTGRQLAGMAADQSGRESLLARCGGRLGTLVSLPPVRRSLPTP